MAPRAGAKSANPQMIENAIRLFDPPYMWTVKRIAEHLDMTPGQVSGLIHRARERGEVKRELAKWTPERRKTLQRKRRPKKSNAAPAGPAEGEEPVAPPREHVDRRVEPAPPPPPPPPATDAPVFRGRASRPCCWPLGEPGTPGFRFCEAPGVPGRSYCEEHLMLSVDQKKMAAILATRRRLQERSAA